MTTPRTLGLCGVIVLAAGTLTLAAQRPLRYAPPPSRLTGTYELESARGDNPQRAADAATRSLPPDRRARAYQNLLTRLEPPQTLAIDRNGQMITISSSSGPRASFDADGQTRDEPGPNGRLIATHAEIVGDRLSVSTSGNRGSDFSVTFAALNDGDRLIVTRRLDNEELREPVTVQSYYRRIANEPRRELSAGASRAVPTFGSGYGAPPAYAPTTGQYMVPDGTRLIATLDTPLSTRTSRSGERFTMRSEEHTSELQSR